MLDRRKFITGLSASSLTLASPALARVRLKLEMVRPRSGEQYGCTFGYRGIKNKDVEEFNWLLRDLKAGESIPIDVDLLEIAARIQEYYAGAPLIIKSGYRTAKTNASIRGAARKSLHIQGRAVDFSIEGVPTSKLVAAAQAFGAGGVGYYRRGFVHIDTGPKRYWRR